jgi:hypothetical protein
LWFISGGFITVTSKQTVFGLLARKGSGKDTAAEVLTTEGYQNVKFAAPLKAMISVLLDYQGVDEETIGRMIEGDLKEVETHYLGGRTPRYAMQTLGTEWGRNLIADDLWVKITLDKALTGPSVITDTRFPNEVDAVSEIGTVIGITADWIEPTPGEHPSEAMIDDLIASLPDNQRIVNRSGHPNKVEAAIQEFRWRFRHLIDSL